MSCCTCQLDALAPFTLDYFVGDTVGIAATITLNAAAYSLVGCALTFRVYDASTSPALLIWDRAIGQGIAVLDAAAGRALITPSIQQSAALVAGRTYTARATLTDAGDAIITTATGYLIAR